jgi:hypothetical protein
LTLQSYEKELKLAIPKWLPNEDFAYFATIFAYFATRAIQRNSKITHFKHKIMITKVSQVMAHLHNLT